MVASCKQKDLFTKTGVAFSAIIGIFKCGIKSVILLSCTTPRDNT